MIRFVPLDDNAFRILASGKGDAAATKLLRTARLSKMLLMLRHLASSDPSLAGAVEALSAAQRRAPEPANAVLCYPWVAVWAARCAQPESAASEREYLRCVAAAACKIAGVEDAIAAALQGGGHRTILPSLGIMTDGAWHPVRKLKATHHGLAITLTLDDLDPYRDCHEFTVSDRLSPVEWMQWQATFGAAWRLLADHLPHRSAELSAGLSSIVPLKRTEKRKGMGVTNSDAFGGLAATLPQQPAQLAATLVHEFQHSKLNALLDLIPLYDQDHDALYSVPWRQDPRPIGGVLHGLYAFTAVAEVWGAFRRQPELTETATEQFLEVRGQVAQVMEEISGSPALTPHGRVFVQSLATRSRC